jgi:hypothetical protein
LDLGHPDFESGRECRDCYEWGAGEKFQEGSDGDEVDWAEKCRKGDLECFDEETGKSQISDQQGTGQAIGVGKFHSCCNVLYDAS